MNTIIGLLVVMGAVLGGYAMAGGPFAVLLQPNELVVIGGAAVGTVMISSARASPRAHFQGAEERFSGHPPTQSDYLDLLESCSSLQLMRARESSRSRSHVQEPENSTVFQSSPSIFARHHAFEFLVWA